MAVRPLTLFPDSTLSTPCAPVKEFGKNLAHLIADLRDTMEASPGVGLAAPQIGVGQRVSVIDTRRSKRAAAASAHGFIVLVNPELVHGAGVQVPREGCLSVPDLLANVRRFEQVVVRTQDERGEQRLLKASGFEALALQHEIDHLDGKLFLDRIENLKTDLFRRKMI